MSMDVKRLSQEMLSDQYKQPSQKHSDCEQHKNGLSDLPEACIALILSWLHPQEVAKLACVCHSFHAASESDVVWERMLPPSYKDVLALTMDVAPRLTSKKEVFEHLCNPRLFTNGTQGYWLDRGTGGVCLSLSARGISIVWSDDARYWDWISSQNSMFHEVAYLKNVCWFEASGQIECALPPGAYTFSWRIFLDDPHGWQGEPAHFTFSKNDFENSEYMCYIDSRPEVARQPVENFKLPAVRIVEDHWREYDAGEFIVERSEGTCVLKFSMLAIDRGEWKSGLIMDGVVVQPRDIIRQPLLPSPHAGQSIEVHTLQFQPEGPGFQLPEVLQRRRLLRRLGDPDGRLLRRLGDPDANYAEVYIDAEESDYSSSPREVSEVGEATLWE